MKEGISIPGGLSAIRSYNINLNGLNFSDYFELCRSLTTDQIQPSI